jgi:branched-chain amino acid transport system substrate-binding protein
MKLQRFVSGIASGLSAAALLTFAPASAMAADYVMSASADFTGPFADVAPSTVSGIRAIAAWWNDTKGKELGTNVDIKVHDMRYDASVVASTWPSILAADKPIMHLGFGTPDLITLMKRLPGDKVPMLMSTAMVGLVWKPNGWHFSFRPTYSHEFVGLLNYLQQKKGGKLTIGAISTQTAAGFVDQVKGVQKFAETNPDRFAVLDVQWVDASPVSVVNEVRTLVRQQPDVILVGGTTAQVVATGKALRELGANIPIIMSTHNGLTEVAKGIDLKEIEGSYSAFAFTPDNQEALPVRDLYTKYHTGAGNWGIAAAQSSYQALLALRVLEQAIAKGSKDAVTGQAMYDAMLGADYSEASLMGSLPDIKFDTTAPFPVGKLKVKAQVVRDGKIATLGNDWLPVPDLPKW